MNRCVMTHVHVANNSQRVDSWGYSRTEHTVLMFVALYSIEGLAVAAPVMSILAGQC